MSRFSEYLVIKKDDYFYLSIEKEPFILALNNPELSYHFAKNRSYQTSSPCTSPR